MSPKRNPAARKTDPEREERARETDSLNAYIRDIARFRPLPIEQERELGQRIQQGDREALNRLVEANLRFVVSYAKRFDPGRNVKFISYAVWWVRQAIFHALAEHARVFRLPQKLSGQVSKVGNLREQLTAELMRAPTNEEVAEKAELSEQEVEAILRASGEDVSLSTELGDEGSLQLGDTLEQDAVPAPEIEMIRNSFAEQIQAMVAELDEKERQVIRMRFGLDGEEPRTLQEIGATLGLSRERIRQIESKAKEKLRRNQKAQGLRGYLN